MIKTPLEHIDSFIIDIDRSQNLDDILVALRKQIDRLGFEKFTYWLIWPPGGPRVPLYLGSYPPEWSEHYIKNNFKSDDMVGAYAATTSRPFAWADVKKVYSLTDAQKIVFYDGIDIGLKAGGSIPIHGPGEAKASFSVANNCPEDVFAKHFIAHRHELHLIATYAHEKIMRLGLDQKIDNNIRLTAREREVLVWTARGKTRWEISEILNVSEETVKKHLLQSSVKLNANNKTHAIATALMNGLILP